MISAREAYPKLFQTYGGVFDHAAEDTFLDALDA
ncbi:hypothetical protein M2271_000928 [Streptomyces sp. LBL]|nr:hypothetical protein [Streptomyces sp. LBL]